MNQREIKFRAWDKEKKKMFLPAELHFATMGYKPPYLNGIDEKNQNCFELMQYTGLKDKQDKKIWEGDIVKINNRIGYVLWDKEGSWYISDNGLITQFDTTFIEIIGNIYENPELIKI